MKHTQAIQVHNMCLRETRVVFKYVLLQHIIFYKEGLRETRVVFKYLDTAEIINESGLFKRNKSCI